MRRCWPAAPTPTRRCWSCRTRLPDAPAMFGLRDPDGNSLILVEGA